MLTYFLTALQLGTAAILFSTLIWVFARHVRLGICLLLCPDLIDQLTQQRALGFDLGHLTISTADVVTACAAVVLISRLVAHRIQGSPGVLALGGLLALTALSAYRGMSEFGLERAANECRPYAYFLMSSMYIATMGARTGIMRFALKAWCVLAGTYALVSVCHWWTTGIKSANEYLVVDGAVVTARPVFAAGALVIGQAAVLLITMRWHTLRYRILVAGLLLTVILLQHRTVWIATAVAIVAYLLLGRAAGTERFSVAGAAAFACAVAPVALSLLSLAPLTEELSSSYSTMQGTHSTFAWRVTGWNELLSEKATFLDTALGRPFGTGYARLIAGNVVTVSPHNFYLQTSLRLGITGLVVCVGLYLWTLLALRSGSRSDLLGRLIALTQLTFCFAYSPSMEQGVALGLVLWHLRRAPSNQERRGLLRCGLSSEIGARPTRHSGGQKAVSPVMNRSAMNSMEPKRGCPSYHPRNAASGIRTRR